MEMIETKNAIISSAEIINHDQGYLTVVISLDYGKACQKFGDDVLYVKVSEKENLDSFAGHFIYRVMEIAGVTKWSEIIGQAIRVKAGFSRVHAIGHILKDDWFSPKDDQDIGDGY